MFLQLGVATILLGAALSSGVGGGVAGSDTELQFNASDDHGASSALTFNGSTLKVAPTSDDLTNVLSLQNAGTNPGQAGFRLSDRNPVGNALGSAADIHIQASSSLSALYLHKNSTPNDTDWFKISVNPVNIIEIGSTAEYEALETAPGVITLTEDTSFVLKGGVVSDTRIVLSGSIDFTYLGLSFANASHRYTGSGTWLTADGAGIVTLTDINGLIGTGSGTFIDVSNVTQLFQTLNSIVVGWGTLGTFESCNNVVFRRGGVFNNGSGFVFTNCPRTSMGVAMNNAGSGSINAPLLTFNGPLAAIASRVIETTTTLNSGESLIQMDKELSLQSRLIIQNTNLLGDNLDLFTPNAGSPQNIETVVADDVSGTLTAFADNGSGGTTVTPSSMTGLNQDQTVTIDTTTSYNGEHFMFAITGTTFDIPIPFVADDATGNFNADSVTLTLTAHGRSNGEYVEAAESNSYNGFFKVFKATTDTFNISTTFVSNQTGTIDEAFSFNQKDSRVLSQLNPSLEDTFYAAAFNTVENATVTTVSTADTFQDIDISGATGAITAFADAGGGFTTVTSAAHGLVENQPHQIVDNPNGYSGTFRATSVTTNTYDIPVAFTVTGTGNFIACLLADTENQRFRVIDEVTGEVEYTGNEIFDGNLTATIGSVKSGAEANYNFILAKNGIIEARKPYVTMGIKSTLTNVTLVSPIRLVKGDTMLIEVAGVGTTDNLTIVNLSFLAGRR